MGPIRSSFPSPPPLSISLNSKYTQFTYLYIHLSIISCFFLREQGQEGCLVLGSKDCSSSHFVSIPPPKKKESKRNQRQKPTDEWLLLFSIVLALVTFSVTSAITDQPIGWFFFCSVPLLLPLTPADVEIEVKIREWQSRERERGGGGWVGGWGRRSGEVWGGNPWNAQRGSSTWIFFFFWWSLGGKQSNEGSVVCSLRKKK